MYSKLEKIRYKLFCMHTKRNLFIIAGTIDLVILASLAGLAYYLCR